MTKRGKKVTYQEMARAVELYEAPGKTLLEGVRAVNRLYRLAKRLKASKVRK